MMDYPRNKFGDCSFYRVGVDSIMQRNTLTDKDEHYIPATLVGWVMTDAMQQAGKVLNYSITDSNYHWSREWREIFLFKFENDGWWVCLRTVPVLGVTWRILAKVQTPKNTP